MAQNQGNRPPVRNQGRQQGRPSSGDLTGRTKVEQAKQSKDELADRQHEISMQNAVIEQESLHGVFDPQTGARVNGPEADEVVEVVEELPAFGRSLYNTKSEQVLTGQESVEEQQELLASQRAQVVEPSVQIAYSPMVTIRVNEDIDDMTYGMKPSGEPNNFTFKEGIAYRVSRDLAEWLNERGVVSQLVSA